ncbi:MAG: rhodanese-like domain-containing protein [Clostridia bacterium]|nr:rhodanese-like domain-containing protein [Clostridia bacterium]
MYKNIDFEQAKQIIDTEDVVLLDVRTEEEFVTGHIINAINIPIDELEYRLNELKDKDEKILVYCKSGARSVVGCEILGENGYTNIYNIGGVVDWPYGLEM